MRFGRVRIKRPKSCPDPQAPESIEVSAQEVLEDASTVVGTEAPVHWRLLSTHLIDTLEDAQRLANWYSQRWHIEQTFRTLKRQGLDVESSQVETAQGLMKLACLALETAVRTMQLTLARDGQGERPASDAFSSGDMAILGHLQCTLEGRTAKQKNPHPAASLAWAAWTIARLGGCKGYASERKPGPITMHDGLVSFALIATGWRAALGEAGKDVCMPSQWRKEQNLQHGRRQESSGTRPEISLSTMPAPRCASAPARCKNLPTRSRCSRVRSRWWARAGVGAVRCPGRRRCAGPGRAGGQ